MTTPSESKSDMTPVETESEAGPSGDQSGPSTSGAGSGPLSITLDTSSVASVLNRARGPILERISGQVQKFSGDGRGDISDWLASYERYCQLEEVGPAELLLYMLDGSAARLYARMPVGDVRQWGVVKATLLAEYAMPRQEAWRKFTECQLEAGDSVDVYLDRLERFGGRIGLASADLAFRTKFYEGLPASVYEWAVSHESAYTADFGTVLSRVRERLVSRKAAAGRQRGARGSEAVAAAGQQRSLTGGGLSCFRCGGAHRVRQCPSGKRAQPAKQTVPTQASSGKRPVVCFRCGGAGHFARDCPATTVTGSTAGSGSGFHGEGAGRGAASSPMETEQS